MKKMKAMQLIGPQEAKLINIDMPQRKKNEALLKPIYSGVCGSDMKMYLGKMNNATYPIISGHEFSAEIVDIDSEDFTIGDIVTAIPYFQCGKCYSCRKGYLNCCENNRCMGVRIDGSFQEYLSMPVSKLCHGRNLDAKTLAMIEPFANARQLIKRVGVHKDETFLIFGSGPIGALAAVDAARLGAEVYIADIAPARLDYARKMGIDGIINLQEESLDEALQRITGGDGFNVTIEAVGHPAVFQDCIKAVSYRGRMGVLGVTKESFQFNQAIISWKEFSIIGSRNSEREDFELLIDLLSRGEMATSTEVISDIFSFYDSVDMFKELEGTITERMKVMVDFS